MSRFYITTAIDYANGSPHVGHAYEKVLADVIGRHRRLRKQEVYFLTGLDEHGQKVQQKAQAEGLSPLEFCDRIHGRFRELLSALDVHPDDFIRTTEARHTSFVRACLQRLYDDGQIYKKQYSGFYSVREERFLQEKDRVEGAWPTEYGEVKFLTEENYFFRLACHREWLQKFLEEHPDFVEPSFRHKQVVEFLREPLNDLCISRPIERLAWGVPLPFDPQFVTYVWFDALLNYASAVEKKGFWPAQLHVVGKDILVPAHAVYWPIILKALDRALPEKILAHGWWLNSGNKLSKSVANASDPIEWIRRYGADACRYFFMREMTTGQDGEFSETLFEARYNADLANEWGNLVARTLNMIIRYLGGVLPAIEDGIVEEIDKNFADDWALTYPVVLDNFDRYRFSVGLGKWIEFVRHANRYVDQKAPWKLYGKTDEISLRRLRTTLLFLAEGIRVSAIAILPITPNKSAQILHYFGMELPQTWDDRLAWSPEIAAGRKVSTTLEILFPKHASSLKTR